MDTKERSAATRRRRTPPAAQRGTVKNKAPARSRRASVKGAAKPPVRQKRVVRAPRQDVPEIIYTMPRTLGRRKLFVRLASVAAVVAALMMAVSIFFRVDTVTVQGAHKYAPWAIREASGISDGDGLLTLSRARAAGKIKSALPYVDDVKISISLPGTVHIEVYELDVTYAIAATDNSWWLISSGAEAVEQITESDADGYTRILGVRIDAPRIGKTVSAAFDAGDLQETQEETQQTQNAGSEETLPTQPVQTNAQRLQAVLAIVASLEDNAVIGQVSQINVGDLTDIQLDYGHRFLVKLGNVEDLAYKVGYMAQAVKQIEEHETGVLDLTFEFRQEGIFTPES